MTNYYTRWRLQNIQQAMKTRRVLLLSGARQCGKTTLAKTLAGDDTVYYTLDDLAVRRIAEEDPHGFVKHNRGMMIIDEVQRVPTLLSAIKMRVDDDTRAGQYLLTGSANIQSLPATQESLAGRIQKIRLRPLTQGELIGAEPNFLKKAFEGKFTSPNKHFDRETLLEMAFRGGFPEAITFNNQDRKQWHKDYIDALIERDLHDISRIHRQDAMHQLVYILASWSSKFMDVASIGGGLSIKRPTVESYINALETLFIVERVLPWTRTDYARVGKQSKLFITDSGLMASVLGWRYEQVQMDSDRSGKLIETLIFNEIAALVDTNSDYTLFHYRDREQREIDFLIECADGALLGIEVKAGSALGKHDAKHLNWFKNNIAADREFIGIILYSGNTAGSLGNNIWAVPFGCLWY